MLGDSAQAVVSTEEFCHLLTVPAKSIKRSLHRLLSEVELKMLWEALRKPVA
ncbi:MULTISPECIES: hypothetical protein [Haematobacter]|uniref:hypothetical protein n=1 Tax=Haematobacter TaxID=366614 RepID=UPI0012EBECA8|nr:MULTISPECIES: hypothetical protein [Haematobacter]